MLSSVAGTVYSWVPLPSRVQITPQALASGLAIACPARSRQSGTPCPSSRWQKPSISASGGRPSRAGPISQRAIVSMASSARSSGISIRPALSRLALVLPSPLRYVVASQS